MPGVVTAGETMVLGVPARPGRLRHASSLELKIGGAESNLAIALSRLGISAGWVGFLGDDEPGQLVLDRIRGEGVDTSRVRRLRDHPTGLYLREQVGQAARVYYYRRGSAPSAMARGARARSARELRRQLPLQALLARRGEGFRRGAAAPRESALRRRRGGPGALGQ